MWGCPDCRPRTSHGIGARVDATRRLQARQGELSDWLRRVSAEARDREANRRRIKAAADTERRRRVDELEAGASDEDQADDGRRAEPGEGAAPRADESSEPVLPWPRVDDRVDAMDGRGSWFEALAVEASATHVWVRFEGWAINEMLERGGDRLAPVRTHTADGDVPSRRPEVAWAPVDAPDAPRPAAPPPAAPVPAAADDLAPPTTPELAAVPEPAPAAVVSELTVAQDAAEPTLAPAAALVALPFPGRLLGGLIGLPAPSAAHPVRRLQYRRADGSPGA